MLSRPWVPALLGLGLLLPVQAGSRVEIDGQVLKDAEYGYELNPIRGWDAIPHKPGERSAWQRAWGGAEGQRFEILVWPEDASKPSYVDEDRSAGRGEFHELYQAFNGAMRGNEAARRKVEELRLAYNAALESKGEEQDQAFAKCREGYKGLLKEAVAQLDQAADRVGLKKAFEADRVRIEALDPASPGFKDDALLALDRLWRTDSVPRYLLSEMKMSKLVQSPFAGASKGARYDFVSGNMAGMAVEIPAPGRKFALVYTCSSEDFKRAVGGFEASARSFKASSKWTGAKAAEPTQIDENDPKAVARSEAMKGVAGVPGWWTLETKRYIVVTNLKKEASFPKAVAEHLESIRDLYEKLIPPERPITAISIVRICKSEREYMNYGSPEGSAGYWSSYHKELVLYGPENAGRTGEEKTLLVLRHEAFHQYIFYCMGDVAPHSWVNEGTAEFFAGAKPVKGASKTTFLPQEHDWRTNVITEAIGAGSYVPLERILNFSQAEYYRTPDICYAEGWSIVYYLLKATPPDSPYRRILPTYLATLERTKSDKEANAKAFEGIDVAALERDWAAFWKNTSLRMKVAKSDQVAPIMLPRE